MWALLVNGLEFLGNGSKSVVPLQRTETELLKSATIANTGNKTLQEGVF
jgi:hypothetical protein